MKVIGIIPARFASTRFPGKPLELLGGKTIIERVYRRVEGVLDRVVVATDDDRIASTVLSFGGEVVMTSTEHRSGTDRIMEAYDKLGETYDVVVNIQGDEPFIHSEQIKSLCACFDDDKVDIATLVKPFTAEDGWESVQNPNSPKVVFDKNFHALYFSRSVVPYLRGESNHDLWPEKHNYYKHIGMYAYRTEVLRQITALPQSSLEIAESLEQLRWLENGYTIKVGITQIETIGIDTPEDLAKAEQYLSSHQQ